MVHGAEVLMHYLKCYQDYGDIIKEAISKTRNIDQATSAHTLVTALQKMYLNLLDQNNGVLDKSSQDFAQLKGKSLQKNNRPKGKIKNLPVDSL